MAEPVIWLELLKTAVTTGATVVVGYWAIQVSRSQRDVAERQASTAAMQRKIAEAKLQLDLFEQRYAVFEKVWEFLSASTNTDGAISLHADLTNLIPKAKFLFGKTIANYMLEAHEKRVELDAAWRRYKARTVTGEEDTQKITELEGWFHDEASNCFKHFAEYLDFSRWRVDPIDRFFNRESV
jgi:hypothetical protein